VRYEAEELVLHLVRYAQSLIQGLELLSSSLLSYQQVVRAALRGASRRIHIAHDS
jgi:hypothetical protein